MIMPIARGAAPEPVVQKLKKKPFKLDLTELHAICDANYARLLRLFPDYENCNSRDLLVGVAKVHLSVVERCRYTTMFQLCQQRADSRWLGALRVEVRAYHDMRMLEVMVFQSSRQVAARYHYPNERMFAQDEKYQQNRFLADWLEHCLQNGRASLDVDVPMTDFRSG
tara:strand:- start:3904 stop:4407 length:504 start_codon:yes stop_codon:yes gene_type:complete